MKVTLKIKKVDCANCAAKIEDKIKKISGLSDVNYNFMSEKLTFHCDKEILEAVYPQVEEIVHLIEPDAQIERHDHHHHDEHCDCGHEHHHHEKHCNCEHEHHPHDEHCDCGHDHHHEEHCDCG
ncbi:MAG: cation transporter, partial [Erysipelotrichaceae bacterium]|nr:cation transporter [Erysipelotrichaceae bacterium]